MLQPRYLAGSCSRSHARWSFPAAKLQMSLAKWHPAESLSIGLRKESKSSSEKWVRRWEQGGEEAQRCRLEQEEGREHQKGLLREAPYLPAVSLGTVHTELSSALLP